MKTYQITNKKFDAKRSFDALRKDFERIRNDLNEKPEIYSISEISSKLSDLIYFFEQFEITEKD